MSKKSFVIILGMSVGMTIAIPLVGFLSQFYQIMSGWPFAFTNFSFLGSTTNYTMLLLNVIFWFVVLFVIWKVFQLILKK